MSAPPAACDRLVATEAAPKLIAAIARPLPPFWPSLSLPLAATPQLLEMHASKATLKETERVGQIVLSKYQTKVGTPGHRLVIGHHQYVFYDLFQGCLITVPDCPEERHDVHMQPPLNGQLTQ